MNRKDFDSLLQNKLGNFSSPYSEKVWQNLEKELDREKDKVGALWFFRNNLSAFLLVFAISCIAAFGYYQYGNTSFQLPLNQQTHNSELKLEPAKNAVTPEKKIKENNSTQENKAPISLLNNTSNNRSNELATAKSLNFKSAKSNAHGFSNSANKSLESFSGFNQVEPSNKLIASDNISQNRISLSNNTQKVIYNNAELNTISSQKIMSVKSSKKHIKLMDNMFPNPKRNCPTFNTNVPDYYLEIFGSPDYTFRTIEAKDNEYSEYKNAKINSETELLGYTLGIRGELALRNGLSFKTGLLFSNIREKFHHTIIGEEIPRIKVIATDTIHYGTSVSYTYDTIHYIEIGNRTITSENSIKTIEIPFLLAYQFEFTRWTFQVNAGVGVQISNVQHGYVLVPSLEPKSFEPSDLDHYNIYKRQWGLSFLGGIQFGYKLTGQLQVFAEPYAKFYPNNINVDGYPLTQKMLTMGTNLGIKYRL
ncbi:MAG TPA: hypothetical protein VK590_04945 [Saprospiraceae bacterium]|nr:hypothetical protein [Saprospiraceae bacterium]